jgi:DNA-binding MltR family transcriptional regulator
MEDNNDDHWDAEKYWAGIYDELNHASDRVTAIAAMALVEALLRDAITTQLPVISDAENLFEGSGPLVALVPRLQVAHAFGLVTRQTIAEIKVCGKIRNLFAHSFQPISFSDEKVVKFIAKLTTSNKVAGSPWGHADNRSKYLTALFEARFEIYSAAFE